jgi:hypothetical protein
MEKMKVPYKVLFFLENSDVIITEIKRTDVIDDNPDKKYHWVFYEKKDGSIRKLTFISMDYSNDFQKRFFQQGELKFNSVDGSFIEKGMHIVLQNHTGSLLPEVSFEQIYHYLDQSY